MNSKVTTDLSFGRDNEIRVKQRLQRLFGPLEETDAMDEFDFKNDNFYIELKTRRVTKNKYHTTMVGENKVLKGFQHQLAGKRVLARCRRPRTPTSRGKGWPIPLPRSTPFLSQNLDI